MRVLLVKLSSLGDVVHTFPAVSDLAAARPGVEIDWVVEEAFAPFVRLHPALSETHALGFRRRRWPPGRWPGLASELASLRRRFRERQYDSVIDLQGLMKSAVVARLVGAPVSGYDSGSAREPFATRLYAERFPVERRLLAVDRTRRLMAAAAGYDLPQTPPRFGLARPSRPAIPGLPSRYVVAVHAASWPSKLWPEPRWRELFGGIGQGRAVVLPWGTEAEHQDAVRLATAIPQCFVLPRRLAGADLCGVLAHADAAVGLDSGVMHLAAALGTPGVWLFGPTDPGLTGPVGDRQVVVRSTTPGAPCRRRVCEHGKETCMDGIAVEPVADALARLLR